MFTRKSSNTDFFIKLLLQVGYELLLSEMQKNWGVTGFVSEIQHLKGNLILKNRSSLRDLAPMSACLKILQMNL